MDHGEETNPVRGDEKSLMGVGVKHKLVLKTDHLGWGPSIALLRAQNLTENLLANYRPPFVKHSMVRFILWGTFLWLREARVKGSETGVDRQSLAMGLTRGMSLNQRGHDTATWNQKERFPSRMD